MIRRLRLPLEDEDHMPPEGKPQPTERDIALIEWWVNAGASKGKTLAELKPPPNIASLLASPASAAAPAVPESPAKTQTPPAGREEILPVAAQVAQDLAIPITPLSETDPWLQANASILGSKFGDAELGQLAKLGANLKWLDLGGTKVTDAGLEKLAEMPNLVRLHLERTGITDEGLARLAALPDLEYLNLYGTQLTDAGLQHLRGLPNLRQLYLWQTKVSPEAAKAFADARIDKVQIQHWEEEIQQLQARIRNLQMLVDVGSVTAASAPATTDGPINTLCPVSGKPVDPSKTHLYDGKLVAFCCNDCKSKFQADPKPYLDKLPTTQVLPTPR
jgi:YHS domain-containing protein